MHYYKIRHGYYAAHRTNPVGLERPWTSQVGYVQHAGKEWYAYTPNGVEVEGSRGKTQGHAQRAMEAFAGFTVLRAGGGG